jgi:hypothetical protein
MVCEPRPTAPAPEHRERILGVEPAGVRRQRFRAGESVRYSLLAGLGTQRTGDEGSVP